MATIDAYLQGPPKTDEELQALSDALRGRRRAAQFFAGSTVPQIARPAQREAAQTMIDARNIGLERARAQERETDYGRTLARDRMAHEQAKELIGLRNATSQAGAADSARLAHERDMELQKLKHEQNMELAAAKQRATGSKTSAKQQAKAQEAAADYSKGLDNVMVEYQNIINAIDSGAWTGSIAQYAPTLTDPGQQYESAVNNLTLFKLPEFKLSPVSDNDMRVLRSGSVPKYSSANTKRWAQHMLTGYERLKQVDDRLRQYVQEHGEPPTGEAADEFRAWGKETLYGDGYTFAFDLDASRKSPTSAPAPAPAPASNRRAEIEERLRELGEVP